MINGKETYSEKRALDFGVLGELFADIKFTLDVGEAAVVRADPYDCYEGCAPDVLDLSVSITLGDEAIDVVDFLPDSVLSDLKHDLIDEYL